MIPFVNPERRSELFGGQGEVLVESLRGTVCDPFSAVLHCELQAGASVGEHVQQADDEIVVVLDGHGTLTVDRQPIHVAPGNVVGLALGQILSLAADSSGAMRYLIIKAQRKTA